MAERLPMGQKELLSGKVMERVKRGHLTIGEAAKEMKGRSRQGGGYMPRIKPRGIGGLFTGAQHPFLMYLIHRKDRL